MVVVVLPAALVVFIIIIIIIIKNVIAWNSRNCPKQNKSTSGPILETPGKVYTLLLIILLFFSF